MTTPDRHDDLSRRTFAIIGVLLVALSAWLRFMFANFGYFSDGDQSAIAYGIASLVRGTNGRLYNYPEQVGYYETAKWLFDMFGSSLVQIRDICIGMGATAATGIGALVLFLFPEHLSRRVRLLASAFVLLSPVLWKLAQYGNTALPSCFWIIAAFVATQFRTRWTDVAAILLWGIGLSYRADAILVAPALAACFMYREGGRLRNGILGLIACGCVFVGVKLIVEYGAGVSGASSSLLAVMFNTTQRGHHLTYVFWGIGPVILAFVAAGWPSLSRGALWKILALWAAAPFVFYFAWSTTPRYYMLLVVPAAIVAALGFDAIWKGLAAAAAWIRWPARVLTVAIALAPLNFTLSEALPGDLDDWQTPQMYQTGDGPHYYGALLNDHRVKDPFRGLPIDAAAQELATMVANRADKFEWWIVINDYWDDVYVSSFYLVSDVRRTFSESNGYVLRIGSLTVQFLTRSEALTCYNAGEAGKKMMNRLVSADRVFRPLRAENRVNDMTTERFTRNGVKVISPAGAALTELSFPNPPAAATRAASQPTSRPASRPATRPTTPK